MHFGPEIDGRGFTLAVARDGLQDKRAFIPEPLVPIVLLVGTNVRNKPPSTSPGPFSIGWEHQLVLNGGHRTPPVSEATTSTI